MMNIKQYPIYENPYDALKIDPDTVLKLHAVPLGENELSPYITSLSPYTAKLQAYFRLFGIKHELVSEPIPDVGPRGKVPFISVGDTRIADSGLVIDYLKRTLGSPDAHLTTEQTALGHYEFFDQGGWNFLMRVMVGDPTALPAEIQEALRLRREDFRKRCYGQGIARFTQAEVIDKAKRDLAAIDVLIGDKRFLLGNDSPSSYDAVVFGFTQAFFQARGMHPEITDFARKLPNLGRFIATVTAEWFPELKLAFRPA
jgi:glutathione S-transferase